jgi:hypothetical protein
MGATQCGPARSIFAPPNLRFNRLAHDIQKRGDEVSGAAVPAAFAVPFVAVVNFKHLVKVAWRIAGHEIRTQYQIFAIIVSQA